MTEPRKRLFERLKEGLEEGIAHLEGKLELPTFLELLHGTSSKFVKSIQLNGLPKGTSLTNDEGIAEYFAEEAVEVNGGRPIWIRVLVPADILEVDYPMLEEPILFYAENLPFKHEAELHAHLNEIGWPSPDDWQVCLDLVGGVKTKRAISPNEIIGIED